MNHTFTSVIIGHFFLLSHTTSGQTMPIYDMIDPANQNTSILFGNPSSAYVHATYLMEYFNNGTVLLTNGAKLINISLNYDLLKDNVITKLSEKDFILDKSTIAEFTIYDVKTTKTHLFKKLVKNNESFFAEKLLVCSSFTLYKKNSMRLREVDPQAGYGSDSYKGKNNLTDQSSLFIQTGSEQFTVERKNTDLKNFLISLGVEEESLRVMEKFKKGSADQEKITLFFHNYCN